MKFEVEVFMCRSDNFGYLVHDTQSGHTAAIDAPDAAAIQRVLAQRGWELTDIWITHHHIDHVEGIPQLKANYDVKVAGPRSEADKIAGLELLLSEGSVVTLGDSRFEVLETPGHTLGHIAYYNAEMPCVFTGDALFSLGCGRMFEGTPALMWEGLRKLISLPDNTLAYFGHEYTWANARFAQSIDPCNEELAARSNEVKQLVESGVFTSPTPLGTEKRTNPFLRADQPELANLMNLPPNAQPSEVFAALRHAKDNFKG